jgi:hypothetical protein
VVQFGFFFPDTEGFLLELFSGGLSVAHFCHPARLKGCREFDPHYFTCSVSVFSCCPGPSGAVPSAGAVALLGASSVSWRRKMEDLIVFWNRCRVLFAFLQAFFVFFIFF